MNETPFEKYVDELELDFERPDSLLNKIKLCSYLICCGASVELESYPLSDKDFRTGNAGLQLLVGNPSLRALIPFFYMDKSNPIKLKGSYTTKQAIIEYAGKEFFHVTILSDRQTGNRNINLEFDTLIAAIPRKPYGIRNCHYHSVGKPCAFCVLTRKQIDLGPADLVSAYSRIAENTGAEPQVLLTGGTDYTGDRGLSKYIPYVKELRSNFREARIAIEASPPKDVHSLDSLIELGMDTFAANIEFHSRKARTALLPGKSEIELEEYEKSLAYCRGAGVKTFSALIAGPEDDASTLKGVEFLSAIGTPANFICLRPFPGASLANNPRVNPAWFLEITGEANKIMGQYNVMQALANTAGCGSCGGCSMEMNLYRLTKNGDLPSEYLGKASKNQERRDQKTLVN
jgi:biotin synthase-like enzyme